MEGWGKIGVQSASVLYPNSCYNESCYIEVQVYEELLQYIRSSHFNKKMAVIWGTVHLRNVMSSEGHGVFEHLGP